MSDDRTLGERIAPDPAVSLCTGTPRLPLPPVDVQPATVLAPPPAGDALAAAEAERDKAYRERAALVAYLAAAYPSVMLTDSAEPDWPIVFVSTPSGQMSWHVAKTDLELFAHVPAATTPTWDGHTTEQKYQRLAELTGTVATAPGRRPVMTPEQLAENWDGKARSCTESAQSTRSLSLYEREIERARTLRQCAMQLRLVLGLEVRNG